MHSTADQVSPIVVRVAEYEVAEPVGMSSTLLDDACVVLPFICDNI